MCSTVPRLERAVQQIFFNISKPYRWIRPSNQECFRLAGIASHRIDLTGACDLPPAFRRPKRRRRGYYADTTQKALGAKAYVARARTLVSRSL